MLITFLTAAASILANSATAVAAPNGAYSCANIPAPKVHGAKVLSIESKERHNFTVSATPPLLLDDVPNLSICDVSVTVSHPNTGDKVVVQVWLPLKKWNGRFVATGGTAWAAGVGQYALAPVLAQDSVAAATDAGVSGELLTPGLWALDAKGKVNYNLLINFASRSIHDMAVVAKAVTQSFYGKQPKYSYWNGCSTGGRQGLVAAQEYPKDFDGILAGAPAISWDKYVVAEHWPQVVMKEAGYFPSHCELDAVTQAAIAACDEIDGVKDGVISNLAACRFDPFTAVGKRSQCEGQEVVISRTVALIVKKIWAGPKDAHGNQLWDGLTMGAPMTSLADTTPSGTTGPLKGAPFFVSDTWIRYYLKTDPNFNTSTIDSAELTKLFSESVRKYSDVIGSDDTDLSGLRKSGGKLLVWQGGSDPLIFPQGTARYRERVEKRMGGHAEDVDNFFRLFFAPGVDHCGQGTTIGAIPSNPFGALISWVEDGKAPDTLPASTPAKAKIQFTRNICKYPLVSKYRGSGDPNLAENFDCVKHY
ncbi:hypothetical protein V490_01797 [Pseudogymnoascus sp. VKM F-3557]|nr:hypothetical protein V490_01797 [Pseudogymnoascus sp. VKM F-3557]